MDKYSIFCATVNSFLDSSNADLLRENANKSATIVSTHRDLLAGILSKEIFVNDILPEHIRDWHKSGAGHYHDADYALSPLTNCQLVNYPNMLANGFSIGDIQIETSRSIGVASTVLTQIIHAVAAAQYGGQTIAHIDTHLAPYVEKSYNKLLIKQQKYGLSDEFVEDAIREEIKAAMQCFIFQINSLTSGNGQSAFVTITFGLETSRFGQMITEEYLKCHIAGLGKNKTTPVFPKVVFMLQEGVNMNPDDPNYFLKQLSIECSSKRIYPDYISVPLIKEVTKVTSDVVSPMGCRSFLNRWLNADGEEQLFGRLNLGVVSLNIALYALQANNDIDEFYHILDKNLEIAFDAQMFRIKRLQGTKAKQNPILFQYGAISRLDADETIDQLFYDGRSSISIGFVGLHETTSILGRTSDKQFALHVLERMKSKCAEFTTRSKISFSLYGTPAESLCYKFAKAIKQYDANVLGDAEYLTNSFHQPVTANLSPFDKWDWESGFANICSGGFIGYIEQPSLRNNLKAYESFINYGYTKLPYFGINTPVDLCYKCGSTHEFLATEHGFECAECGNTDPSTINVIRRVSGYLASPTSRAFNVGKQQEVIQRVKHELH